MAHPIPPHDDLPKVLKDMEYTVFTLGDHLRTMSTDATSILTDITEATLPSITTLFPPEIHADYKTAHYRIRTLLLRKLQLAAGPIQKHLAKLPRPLNRNDAMEDLGLQLCRQLNRLENALVGFGAEVRNICDSRLQLIKADKEVARKADGSAYMLQQYKQDRWYVETERTYRKSWPRFHAAVKSMHDAMRDLSKKTEETKTF